MPKVFTEEDDALLAELGVEAETQAPVTYTPREERIIAGFEEIQRFVEEHDRVPQHGEDNDIFERLYAVRLDRIREQAECRDLVASLDHQGLLSSCETKQPEATEALDDDALLAELGVAGAGSDITQLTHVRSYAEKRSAEEIANRERCEDFEDFEPLFEKIQREIKDSSRKPLRFGKNTEIQEGEFFILGGVLVYVAEMGDYFKSPNGHTDARTRVIYANGTESNLLLRSLQRALYKDENGRRAGKLEEDGLFGDALEDGDIESGTIYILRSKSDEPFVAENRDVIHKIGVTGGKVETRIANAVNEATYMLAEVEIVATYKLVGINRVKLENLLHRIFAPAQIDLTIHDRFGKPVQPREWFLVPLAVIEEAVEKIRDGSITAYRYDAKSASLIEG